MEPITAVLNNVFLIVVLVSAFWYIRRQLIKGDFGHRMIRIIFVLATFLLISDAVLRLNHAYESNNELLCSLCLVIGTSLLPILGLLWFVYTIHVTRSNIKRWILILISSVLFALNLVLAILSFFPGFNIYYIIVGHNVSRGQLYFIYALILILPFLASLITVFARWSVMKKRRSPWPFFNYSVIPIVAVIWQFFLMNYSIALLGIVASFIIIVLDIQHYFAITDFLTGLYNRRNLIKYLTSKMKKMDPNDKYAGFMLDINNFKSINDKYGHSYGDQVLKDVSKVLLSVTERGDYLARFGGDEFVIICSIDKDEEVAMIIDKIKKACDKYNADEKKTHTIIFSIGSAIFKAENGMTPNRFLEVIDDRMYIDKQSSKAI